MWGEGESEEEDSGWVHVVGVEYGPVIINVFCPLLGEKGFGLVVRMERSCQHSFYEAG